MSTERIIETLRYLNRVYDCRFFSLNQEDLTPDQAREMSEAILAQQLEDIYIYTPVRLEDRWNDSGLLRRMRKAGFAQLHWGLESGSQRVLSSMEKGTHVETASQILRKCSESGIGNLCFIFFGFPGETKEEAQQTIEFLKENAAHIDAVFGGTFTLDKYSPVWRHPERWHVEIKEDGGWVSKSGMNREEISAFYSKFFRASFELNTIRTTSGKLNYVSPENYRAMAHFLMSSHHVLSRESLLGYLKEGRLSRIFPMILGEVTKEGHGTHFRPIDIKETTFINRYHPEKEEALDLLEEKIFVLSCGTWSAEEIILVLTEEFKGEYGRELIRKRCVDFFQTVFSKNWGLGFSKSWQFNFSASPESQDILASSDRGTPFEYERFLRGPTARPLKKDWNREDLTPRGIMALDALLRSFEA